MLKLYLEHYARIFFYSCSLYTLKASSPFPFNSNVQLSTRAYTLDLIDHSLVQTCEQFTCELLLTVPSSASPLLFWPLLLLFSCFVSLLISFASFLLCLALPFLYSASFSTSYPAFIFPFPLLLVASVVPSLSRYTNIQKLVRT